MVTRFRANVILVLLCAAGLARAQSAPVLADRSGSHLTGVHIVDARSALVWAESETLHIWRLDITGARANVHIRWTAIPAPSGLKTFKDRGGDKGSPQMHVNLGPSGVIRVFWDDGEREFGDAHFKFDLHQAESRDEGRTWREYLSTVVEPGGGAKFVEECRFVDRLHGWMILTGDPGAGMLPEMLATTSDGGHTWKKIADSDQPATGLPLGINGGQALLVRSATVASFIAARSLEHQAPLVAARTEDGGDTWTNTPVLDRAMWLGASVGALAQRRNDPKQSHRVCVDADLQSYDQPSDSYRDGDARYCSADDGRTWSLPVPVPKPTAIIGDTGPALGHGSGLPVYADAALGFTEVWGDHKAPGWKPDGDPSGHETSREYGLFVTADAGKTWKPVPASIAEHYRDSESVSITQADARGNTVWLLITVPGDSTRSDLFFSADHGITWRHVP
jgi:hypothetical protein